MKHYITKYRENDKLIVESWLQIDFMRWSWCFSKRKLIIDDDKKQMNEILYNKTAKFYLKVLDYFPESTGDEAISNGLNAIASLYSELVETDEL